MSDAKNFSTMDFSSDDDDDEEEEKFDEIKDEKMQLWKVSFKISLSHVSLTKGIPAIINSCDTHHSNTTS